MFSIFGKKLSDRERERRFFVKHYRESLPPPGVLKQRFRKLDEGKIPDSWGAVSVGVVQSYKSAPKPP